MSSDFAPGAAIEFPLIVATISSQRLITTTNHRQTTSAVMAFISVTYPASSCRNPIGAGTAVGAGGLLQAATHPPNGRAAISCRSMLNPVQFAGR